MKILISILLLIGCLFSCTSVERSKKPERLYSEEKMVDIMTDIYIMESAISSNKRAYEETNIQPSPYIYKKYNTDSLQFQENLFYYLDRIEKYQSLMERVEKKVEVLKDSLAVRQERINQQYSEEKPIPKDSILPDIQLRELDPDEEY
ncbi:DUF4296 domain-containing protein [Nonlabens xiamenensis]|uniref:DUF4296 domain-containing protein n=1 Tax=Nonlabens xiamenensis TaxID=2341043 RepID=UPI000F613D43|nr:DUF4296 domain-containing protein [Nonlabens xiamenensis]